jgi:hypothetical protein
MKPLLADLRRELDKSNELFILPLRAIAAQLAGDGATARDLANLLSRSAPSSAETFLLSAILFLRAGRSDLAADEVEEAARMDVRTWDSTILRAYVRWMEVLNDPANEKLESGAEGEKMDLVEMREALDARLKHDHYPAGLLLRAAIECLDGRWDAAEEDLRRLERRLNGRLELASVDHDRLGALVDAIGSRSRLLNATAELQQHLGRLEASYATSLLINGEELPEEERRELLRHVNRRMAHQQRSRLDWALWHVEQALENGLPPQELRADDELGDLRRRPGFESLLRKYERR